MLPMAAPDLSAGSPEPPRPGADPPCAAAVAVRPDADVLPPEAEPLRGSEEPPRWSAPGGFRGDVGFMGWLGTRRLTRILPRRGALGTFTGPKTCPYRSAPRSIQAAISRSWSTGSGSPGGSRWP